MIETILFGKSIEACLILMLVHIRRSKHISCVAFLALIFCKLIQSFTKHSVGFIKETFQTKIS